MFRTALNVKDPWFTEHSLAEFSWSEQTLSLTAMAGNARQAVRVCRFEKERTFTEVVSEPPVRYRLVVSYILSACPQFSDLVSFSWNVVVEEKKGDRPRWRDICGSGTNSLPPGMLVDHVSLL